MSHVYTFHFFVEAIKQAGEEEGVFSESSEDDLIADNSTKLQRTNAKRFGKVSVTSANANSVLFTIASKLL